MPHQRKNIRQSPQFARYLETIGWTIESVNHEYIFIRRIPLLGSMIKAQRVGKTFSLDALAQIEKKYKPFRVVLEYDEGEISAEDVKQHGFSRGTTIFAPSKTIQIDISSSEDEIFQRFTEAKRRGVRRALKNDIIIKETDDIQSFITVKWGSGPFSWLIRNNQVNLWKSFAPKDATVLLAYKKGEKKPLGGILMLFHGNIAYYWQAGAKKRGKKLFAPTLLVWESLKLAKKRGYRLYDFEGVYDERFPTVSAPWRGFTKFKEGFGGYEVTYPEPWVKNLGFRLFS